MRLIEQYDNQREYFLIFGPTTSSFKANVEFASDFESFLTKFQSLKPLIHILHEEMETLLWNVML